MAKSGEKEKSSDLRSAAAGLLISAASAAALLLCTSLLISDGSLDSSFTDCAVTGVNLTSAALGGFAAAGRRGRGALGHSLALGAALTALLLLAGLAAGGGSLSGTEAGRIAACSLGGAMLGGVLHAWTGNKKLHKKHGARR